MFKTYPYPDTFVADQDFHDKGVKWGMQLPKRVVTTNVSLTKQEAGRPLEEIRLLDHLHSFGPYGTYC